MMLRLRISSLLLFLAKKTAFIIASLLFTFIFCEMKVSAGKVNVVNELTTLQYNQKSGSIAIQLSVPAQVNNVNVTCNQLQSGPRLTNLRFSYHIIQIGNRNGNVVASIISHGEAVTVACFGFSINSGNQFQALNSTGNSGRVIVTKAPTVSICDDPVMVKGYISTLQSFSVQLSEPATSSVVIQCSTSTTSSKESILQLEFSQATVLHGQTQANVQFRVQRNGLPVKVTCAARSQNCTSTSSSSVSAHITISISSGFIVSSPSSVRVVSTSDTSAKKLSPSINSTSSQSLKATSSTSTNATSSLIDVSPSPSDTIGDTLDSSLLDIVDLTSFLMAASDNVSSTAKTSTDLFKSTSSLAVSPSATNITTSLSVSRNVSSSDIAASTTVAPVPSPTNTPVVPVHICQFSLSTSSGPSVHFMAQQVSIIAYPSYSDLSDLRKHVAYIALDSALEGSVNMDMQCRIRAIGINQIGETICLADGAPLKGGPEVVLPEITLRLLETKVTFKPGEMFRNITVEVASIGNGSLVQLFQAYCCAPSSNQKYNGTSVSVLLWVDAKGVLPFNWQNIQDQSQQRMTAVESLDFSCPCDVTENLCDMNCCCDKDCLSAEISRFTCIEGAFGGREKSSFEFDCNAIWPDRTDWTPILCVVTNNSPFLGYFYKYTSPALASKLSDFQNLVAGKTQFTYEENETRAAYGSTTVTGYDFGAPIKTDIGFLTVPSQVGDNSCAFSSVRYLVDKVTSCEYKASSMTCSNPSFNALNFLMPTGLTLPSCSVPGVLDGRTSTSLARKVVEYYCLQSSSDYMRITGNEIPRQNEAESLFPSSNLTNSIPRCAFDDSKTRPRPPFVDNSTNTCQNPVLAVNYVLSWNGKNIESITAKITMGSFSINTVSQASITYTYYTERVVTVTPMPASSSLFASPSLTPTTSLATPNISSSLYSLTNVNTTRGLAMKSSLNPTPSGASLTSGAPANASSVAPTRTGSLPFTSIVSSSNVSASLSLMTITVQTSTVIVRNMTITPSVLQRVTVSYKYKKIVSVNASISLPSNDTSVFSRSGNPGYVTGRPLLTQVNASSNSSTTRGLMLWMSSKDGLCVSAKTVPVPFGKNSLSGCTLRFGLDRFANCSALRALVKTNQDNLVSAIRVAKRGNPSTGKVDDWLDIIRNEPTVVTRNLTRAGICYDIPSHLVIEVLVSEAGMTYGESQLEISGVRIRYVTETWSMDCASGSNSVCYNSSEASSRFTSPTLRSFYVTSSVSFIRIPAVDPPRVKRSSDTSGICKYDSCLKEMFYPLLNSYSSNIAQFSLRITQEATAMAMTLLFIAFGALYMSRAMHK